MRKAVFIIAVTLVCLTGIRAQQPRMTTVGGGVFDRTGAWVHQVKIVATDESGKRFEASSGTRGLYLLELPFGVYSISASTGHGFETFTIPVFPTTNRGGRLNLDIVLSCRICPDLPDLRKKLPQSKIAVPTKTSDMERGNSTIH